MPGDELSARFSTWLLRPYLDLGPPNIGPLHTDSLEEGWRALVDRDCAAFMPQRALSPGFRVQLAREAGRAYAIADPRELPDALRTDRWRLLCGSLDEWSDLPDDRKWRLAILLHSMCLYRPLLALVPDRGFEARGARPDAIQLAFWRASAKYIYHLPNRISDYRDADISVFEDIASSEHDAALCRFNATAKVFVHKAKTRADTRDLVDWRARFERSLALATADADEFTTELLTSRFFRGAGFLPQRMGERSELVRVMDHAERHARAMKPTTSAQALLYRENLHAVLESRTKESLWLGANDEALARSVKVTEVDPYDSKAWAELGEVRCVRREWREAAEAYAIAAMLGPPASAVGRHMAAVCLGRLGLRGLAALCFKDTLELDPLGISPRLMIYDLPDVAVLNAVKEWCQSASETLT